MKKRYWITLNSISQLIYFLLTCVCGIVSIHADIQNFPSGFILIMIPFIFIMYLVPVSAGLLLSLFGQHRWRKGFLIIQILLLPLTFLWNRTFYPNSVGWLNLLPALFVLIAAILSLRNRSSSE